jgi:hypothetical protein
LESALKKSFICLGVVAFLPLAVIAQPQVADPASPVPAVLYRSAFVDTPQGVETGTLPWKDANAEVGQFTRGHIDILKWEAAQARQDVAKPAMPMSHGTTMDPKKP